jgi:F0F1-type ATP synthase membrane subunit c/vacuolar-type H+-ATPase subunit K
MKKQKKRWPIWKIGLATGGCALGSVLVFTAAVIVDRAVSAGGDDPTARRSVMDLPGVLAAFGMALGMLAVLGIVWLVYRIRSDRIPAWEKNVKRKKRKKR